MGARQKRIGTMKYQIVIGSAAQKMLSKIKDIRTRKSIARCIDRLEYEPEKQGKSLFGSLSDFRSIRAAGQRYRIIYKVEKEKIIVYIVAAGIRKDGDKRDIYNLTKKLLRLGLLDI